MAIKKTEPESKKRNIVIPSKVMDYIDQESRDDGKKYKSQKKRKLSLREVQELKGNISLLRSSALYLIDISVHMGRGTSNIKLDLEDIISDEEKTSLYQEKSVRTTIKISQLLSAAANKLRSKRGKIIEEHFRRFGEILVCPAEEIQAVEAKIQELQAEAENQRQIIYDMHSHAKRIFLLDVAEIAVTRGYDEEQIFKTLDKYSKVFPSKEEIRNQVRVTVTTPIKLPSISELIQKDSLLAKAEAERAIAMTEITKERVKQQAIRSEADAVQRLKTQAEEQMRQHLSSVIENARTHLFSLVEEKLTDLQNRSPINDAGAQRRFQQFLDEMSVFLEHQDGSLQDMYGEIAGLQSYFEGSSRSADVRRENLESKIRQLVDKYQPKFTSAKTTGQGHRAAALAGMDLDD